MSRSLWKACWCGAFALLLALGSPTVAGDAPPSEPKLSPAQKRAQGLLERWKGLITVQQQERRHRAKQHLAVGKEQFELGAHKEALGNFQKAVELDPRLKEAQQFLHRARGILGLHKRGTGAWVGEYVRHIGVVRQMRKKELETLFAQGKQLYNKGDYSEAVTVLTRVVAKGMSAGPSLDVGKVVEDAQVLVQKSLAALAKRDRVEAERKGKDARDIAKRLREREARRLGERHRALLNQARTLYEHRRYDEARKVCDRLLLEDPTSGAAETLRATAVETARNASFETALRNRKRETERHWRTVDAALTPQFDLVSISRERFEELRRRPGAAALGDSRKGPPDWESRLREAMQKPVSFDFVETPLNDVISFLSTLTGATIVLDRKALPGELPPITLKVGDMRLEKALNWVCKLAGLQYTYRDEAIFISNKVHGKSVLLMYDVSDLTVSIQQFKGRQQALVSDGSFSSTGSQGGGDGLGDDFWGKQEDDDEEDEKLTGKALVEFIKRTIAPGTWATEDEEGGGRIETWD